MVDGITESLYMSLSKLWLVMTDRDSWGVADHGWQGVGRDLVTE